MKIQELFENEDMSKYIDKDGDLTIVDNDKIASLIGCQHLKFNKIFIVNCQNLTSLKGLPKKINGSITIHGTGITSLEGIGKDYICEIIDNNTSFNCFYSMHNPLKSNILGLLKIKGLKEVKLHDDKLQIIMNKYIPLGDVVECTEELIENGFKDYAKF